MNDTDLARIVATGERAASHLERSGHAAYRIAALEVKQSVQPAPFDGPAVELEQKRNTDDDGFRSAISDPTGDAAVANLSSNTLKHRLDAAVRSFDRAAVHLTLTILNAVKDHQQHEEAVAELAADNGPGADWCASCFRDNGYLEPVAVHKDGRVKYRGACKWCHMFEAAHRRPAPLPLLEARHAGRRVSQTDIERAFKQQTRR